MTFIAGFNIWTTVLSPTPVSFGDSNLRTFTLTDNATVLTASLVGAVAALLF